VMDQDQTRRGLASTFVQYTKLANKQNYKQAKRFGDSMAICAGDVCLFLTFDLLSQVKTDQKTASKLQSLFGSELAKLTLGQMKDLSITHDMNQVTEDDILQMYIHKTARYTFTIPFFAGAILAKQTQKTIKLLEQLSEVLGLIFQIKDDEIGLFGNAQKTGKPIASDIREAKKTLYYFHLFKKATKQNSDKLKRIFGNPNITSSDIDFVKTQIEETKTRITVENKLKQLAKQAMQLISKIDNPKIQIFFKELLEYNLTRFK